MNAGLEAYNYSAFLRSFCVIRLSDLPMKIIPATDQLELPKNSLLHLIDQLTESNPQVVPDLKNLPLLFNEKSKMHMLHEMRIDPTKGPIIIEDKFIHRDQTASREVLSFRKSHKQLFRDFRATDDISEERRLWIVNHNPINKIRVNGKMAGWRKWQIILSHVLNSVSSFEKKYQFLHFPLRTKTIYKRTDFQAGLRKIDQATLTYPEDINYFIILEFLRFLNNPSDSIISRIPESVKPYVFVTFSVGNNYMFISLRDIEELNTNELFKWRILNTINLLIASDSIPSIQGDVEKGNLSDDDLETYLSEAVTTTVVESEVTSVQLEPEETLDGESAPEKRPEKINSKILIEQRDNEATRIIDNNPRLTPRQKERMRKVALVYKDLELGGVKLGELLESDPDAELDQGRLEFLEGNDNIVDDSMLDSSIASFDSTYKKKLFKRHLADIAVSFSSQGLFLQNIEETNEITELDRLTHYKLTYESVDGETHTVKFSLPMVDDQGKFLVNGVEKLIKKQLVNVPICKISPTRVSLSSNFNKSIVERIETKAHNFYNHLVGYLEKLEKAVPDSVVISYGACKVNRPMSYEYTTLSSKIRSIKFKERKTEFFFDFNQRFDVVGNSKTLKADTTTIEELEKEYGVFCGISHKPTRGMWFIDIKNQLTFVEDISLAVSEVSSFTDFVGEIGSEHIGVPKPLYERVDLKILDKKLAVIFILAYRFGLLATLRYLSVKFTLFDKNQRINKSPTDLVFRFNDKTLVVNRYPLAHSLIVSGLSTFNTKEYDLALFEDKSVYSDLLTDKGMSANYLKGIDSFFDFFIDPITRDVLIQMGEPTNFRDLLIRATVMLTTEAHIEPSSMANHRVRSIERFNATVYNQMARGLAQYKSRKTTTPFSINPEAVYQQIVSDRAVVAAETINPIHDLKEQTAVTYTGMGGRTPQAFVLSDRKFPQDGLGTLSEATADSGKVAISAYTSADPVIQNAYGMIDPSIVNPDNIKPSQMLSVTSVLMPGSTNDD